jgi:molybdate transport system substrate-binding protein
MSRSLLCCLLLGVAGLLSFAGYPTLISHRPVPEGRPTPQQQVLIAAAADLQFAMDSLIKIFQGDNPGQPIKAIYGSSGNFFEQISNDAPFDLFFSADIDYPRKLQEQGKALSAVRPYATGQIVLWSKKIDPAQAQMNSLTLPSITKIAIANPAHAPYGKRAVESLTYYGLYDKIKDRLVMGENISQTAQFAKSGAADIGIIALSLALSPAMQEDGGKYWLIPSASHQPLQQGYVLLQHAGNNAVAKKFADFMASGNAASVLQYFGFAHP